MEVIDNGKGKYRNLPTAKSVNAAKNDLPLGSMNVAKKTGRIGKFSFLTPGTDI